MSLFLRLLLTSVPLAACSPPAPSNIFAAVDDDNSAYVKAWIKNGGNPNTRGTNGESLLYIATGPHGGHGVLIALLEAGKASPAAPERAH